MSKIVEKRVLFPEACDEVEAGNQWEITTQDLQSMAEQIIEYSDEDTIDCLLLTDVMYILSHRCLSFFEEVDV